MIDVVGADHCAKKLLHVIGIFVDAAGATDAGDGVGAMLGDDFLKFSGNEIECFVPGCFTKLTVFFDKRRFQPVLGIDEIEPVTPLDAQPALVGLCILDAGYLNNSAVFNM